MATSLDLLRPARRAAFMVPMTQATILLPLDATPFVVAAMLLSLALVLVGVLVAQVVGERREPVGAGHHCHPGTCPVCDTFGCWSADADAWS